MIIVSDENNYDSDKESLNNNMINTFNTIINNVIKKQNYSKTIINTCIIDEQTCY